MELANDANKKRMRDGKNEPKSVTIVRKVHGIQQSLIMRRLPINVVENDMAGNTLMSMTIQLLTPTLWDDVVEERSVGGVCGYPFCKNQIAILKKKRRKYGVSLKKAELLNIEGRDAFCSTSCWKASKVLHASLSKVLEFDILPGWKCSDSGLCSTKSALVRKPPVSSIPINPIGDW